ncbi:DNA-directed RNA polymerase subunit omega [Lactobacillus sp. ESL0791]|uniref:DNA-directed RNA polymerase subunit omega n=1 Tax=Lactobacillus sp. ESL0791 TaxID=2983234 RepID=UPI0023F86AAE|nr:DNA-directed RNA polymerase subunit omega [Lactobacillus sp. ESL0791]MDF7638731.1 DNA-directed RNA polymerase subunit omega [Lactobacillus sp. ESL0791]
MRVTYPSIDKLLDQVDSRYSLSVLAAKRAHELEAGDPEALKDYKCEKVVGQALEEIAAGKVTVDENRSEVNQKED